MQPMVSEHILGDPLAQDQGFLSRCLIAAPESMLGEQNYTAQDLTKEGAYRQYCTRLMTILQAQLPRKIDLETGEPTNELIPRPLPLSLYAKGVWVHFHDWIQSHLRLGGRLRPNSKIAAKAAEHALRVAGTLALVDDLNTPVISVEHVKDGIVLAKFYLGEALRLFNSAQTDPDLLLGERVLTWLKTRECSNRKLVSLPDLYQFGPNGVRDKRTAKRIMELLGDHHWARPIEGGTEIEGKKRRQVWEVNPYVFQGAKI